MTHHGSPISAVVFDLDGLLVDSEPVQIAAWEAFLAEFGQTLEPSLRDEMFGLRIWDSARLVVERLALPITVDEVVARRDALFFEALDGNLPALPGAHALIESLRARGIPLALATSGHRRYADVALRELGLAHVFAVEVTGGEVARGKPAPDIYLAAARGLGVAPERCLALEDAPHGVASAKSAGMRCLAVPNPMTANLPGLGAADAILGSLHDVLPWLERNELLVATLER